MIAGIDLTSSKKLWIAPTFSGTWIAILNEKTLSIEDVFPAHALPGSGNAFYRLVDFLRADNGISCVGIDAPFSVPASFIPESDYRRLLKIFDGESFDMFPTGDDLILKIAPEFYPTGLKKYRRVERIMFALGLKPFSPVWNGPRGGAGLTALTLYLLKITNSSIWPHHKNGEPLAVETYPSAQLKFLNLYFRGYKYNEHLRKKIITGTRKVPGLMHYIYIPPECKKSAIKYPDALDAIVAATGTLGAFLNHVILQPEKPECEGWISITEFSKLYDNSAPR